ncbi:hypothetical protein MY5147_006086 [Beauveria neobassiana]
MAFTTNASIRVFGGRLLKLTHQSATTGTPMNLNLFLPASATASATASSPMPVLFYLSGLTCTPDNVTDKAFLQAHAAPLGLALLYPDTSPRALGLPGEDDSWDFGSAASFYVDAVRAPYEVNYKMETYVAEELPKAVFAAFPELDGKRVAVSGHSMGGHGALMLFLKYPGKYKSVSAFAPIANPSECPWGTKAFSGYLSDERRSGRSTTPRS